MKSAQGFSALKLLKVTIVIFIVLRLPGNLQLLTYMRRFGTIAHLFVLGTIILASMFSQAQQSEQSESTRKVVNRVVPQYPPLARTMNLRGLVRAEAVVAPNGTVKSVESKGGHPVLVQAAQNAIRQWKYEPSSHETRESVEIQFNPPETRN